MTNQQRALIQETLNHLNYAWNAMDEALDLGAGIPKPIVEMQLTLGVLLTNLGRELAPLEIYPQEIEGR